jgi:CheY-like chemotaxis protein
METGFSPRQVVRSISALSDGSCNASLLPNLGSIITFENAVRGIHLDADPIRQAQVFLNLLNNAAKYTNRGGQISLSAFGEGGDAVVTVRDNGIGIDSGMLSSVFEMFRQVDRSMEISQGGLGIGLTLVRRLGEMHDGSIEARSDGPNKGSEFVVRLPRLISPPNEKLKRVDGPIAKRLSHGRILVVDDNKDAADSLAMLLRLKGNDIRLAHDGVEALEVAATFHPEIVLLDIGLSKLNGYDVARRIRQQPWAQGVLLIA